VASEKKTEFYEINQKPIEDNLKIRVKNDENSSI